MTRIKNIKSRNAKTICRSTIKTIDVGGISVVIDRVETKLRVMCEAPAPDGYCWDNGHGVLTWCITGDDIKSLIANINTLKLTPTK